MDLRKEMDWSQSNLAKSGVCGEMIGRGERDEAILSIEVAKKIADTFEVSLDYLIDENAMPTFDKKTVNRLKDIQHLNEEDKKHVFALLDAFLARTKIQSIMQ
jgi:transcriptional regulator with XRE-family HTH domain